MPVEDSMLLMSYGSPKEARYVTFAVISCMMANLLADSSLI